MDLSELSAAAHAGDVQELQLLSLEGGLYLLRVQLKDGRTPLLRDASGAVRRWRSSTELREQLRELPVLPCVLLQEVVHDEMCGVRREPVAPLRLPLGLAEPW